MEIKKSEFHHEIEHEGHPPISNFEDYRALEEFLKSMDPDETPIKELECSPPVTPSRIFQLAQFRSFLRKISENTVWYQNTSTDATVTPEEIGLNSNDPSTLVDSITLADGEYRKLVGPEDRGPWPTGKGSTEQLTWLRGELTAKFEQADQMYAYISADKRYTVPGVFGKDQNFDEWVKYYTETREAVWDPSVMRSETEFDLLSARVDKVISDANAAVGDVQEKSVTIPKNSNIYYIDQKFLTNAPSGMEGYVISRETVDDEGKSVQSVQLMLPDGNRIVILQEELEGAGRSTEVGRYYIPVGTPIHQNGAPANDVKYAVEDMRGVKLKEYSDKPSKYGLPEDEGNLKTKIWDFQDQDNITWQVRRIDLRNVNELTSSLKLGKIETTEDRPPYAWRDEPETQEINITHSPVEGDKPFNGPPMSGNVPFLSMPNVGDVMTDRTNTQGHAGDPEYLGKNQKKLDEEKARKELMSKMKTRYESGLNEAIAAGQPSPIVKYYEEMLGRYRDSGK